MRALLIVAAAALGAGCASNIKVYDAAGKQLKGVPIRSPVLVEVTTVTTYEIDPAVTEKHPQYKSIKQACQPVPSAELKVLPLGAVQYVEYDSALLAKSDFKVEYNDNGGVKSIQVGSDPAATAEGAAKLLETVLPFVGKPQVEVAALVDFAELRKKYCIAKATRIDSIKERQVETINAPAGGG